MSLRSLLLPPGSSICSSSSNCSALAWLEAGSWIGPKLVDADRGPSADDTTSAVQLSWLSLGEYRHDGRRIDLSK